MTASQRSALDVLGRETLRLPGSLPHPGLAPGTDTMPGIEHIVVLMMENHSYDNFFGLLGRGDGFTLGPDLLPTASNPYGDGRIQRAFPMPTTCQLNERPSQEWRTSHEAFDGGAMDGFVRAPVSPQLPQAGPVGPVAMGYWGEAALPFTYSLARTFPVADRWFCSVLGQTDPNRRYLIAGTSWGMTDDLSTAPTLDNALQDAFLASPTVTIFDVLTAFGISWTDYYSSWPFGATAELYPVSDTAVTVLTRRPVSRFFSDAAAGSLPAFCIVEPDYNTQSQENPQNIAVGDAFMSDVVHAVGASPDWERTLLVITYDEHGGYYDHIAPPVALAPDVIPPVVGAGESAYDGFERYGFRVPSLVVSPFAKRNYVSHTVFDHTSVLALVERKWNLPALTWRDANANDLTDLLDLGALADGSPTFPALPALAPPGDTPGALACSSTGPGAIPPAWSVIPS